MIENLSFPEALKYAYLGDIIFRRGTLKEYMMHQSHGIYKVELEMASSVSMNGDSASYMTIGSIDHEDLFSSQDIMSNEWIARDTACSV